MHQKVMRQLSKKIKTILLASLFASISLSQLLAQTNQADQSTSLFPGQITNQLSQFETTVFEIQTNAAQTSNQAFDKLALAIEQLKGTIDALKNQPKVNRKVMAGLWLDVLGVLDKHMDSNFGTAEYLTTNKCSLNLIPPQDGPDGPIYPSGVSVDTLKNPAARAEYAAMLKTNREHANHLAFQNRLQRVDNQAMSGVENFIRSSYTSSESDRTEFDEAVLEAKLSTSRKQQIIKRFRF